MTPTEHDNGGQPISQFARSRARALRERTDHRDRAVRTVAGQARDREEFIGLLSMLGLDNEQGGSPALSQALARYVRQVATAVAVPADAVGYEVSDTATAYLGLAARLPEHAGRDLMLVWDEQLGWYVGVETHPDETPLVICYFGGEAVPPIDAVARFVADVVSGRHTGRLHPVPPPSDRIALARLMAERTES